MIYEKALQERPWMRDVKIGTKLDLSPDWNKYTSPHMRIEGPVTVHGILDVKNCQSGVMYQVETSKGHMLKLDAAWFKGIADE